MQFIAVLSGPSAKAEVVRIDKERARKELRDRADKKINGGVSQARTIR